MNGLFFVFILNEFKFSLLLSNFDTEKKVLKFISVFDTPMGIHLYYAFVILLKVTMATWPFTSDFIVMKTFESDLSIVNSLAWDYMIFTYSTENYDNMAFQFMHYHESIASLAFLCEYCYILVL